MMIARKNFLKAQNAHNLMQLLAFNLLKSSPKPNTLEDKADDEAAALNVDELHDTGADERVANANLVSRRRLDDDAVNNDDNRASNNRRPSAPIVAFRSCRFNVGVRRRRRVVCLFERLVVCKRRERRRQSQAIASAIFGAESTRQFARCARGRAVIRVPPRDLRTWPFAGRAAFCCASRTCKRRPLLAARCIDRSRVAKRAILESRAHFTRVRAFCASL